MLAQIELMQLQIRQLIIARIHYCDQELAIIDPTQSFHKTRTIAKKRNLYRNQLKKHMEQIF